MPDQLPVRKRVQKDIWSRLQTHLAWRDMSPVHTLTKEAPASYTHANENSAIRELLQSSHRVFYLIQCQPDGQLCAGGGCFLCRREGVHGLPCKRRAVQHQALQHAVCLLLLSKLLRGHPCGVGASQVGLDYAARCSAVAVAGSRASALLCEKIRKHCRFCERKIGAPDVAGCLQAGSGHAS